MGERWGGWRWWRGGAASPPAVVMVVMASALPHRHDVLEADVRLRGVVDAVGDRYHGDRVDGAAAGAVTAAHQRTWGGGGSGEPNTVTVKTLNQVLICAWGLFSYLLLFEFLHRPSRQDKVLAANVCTIVSKTVCITLTLHMIWLSCLEVEVTMVEVQLSAWQWPQL